MLYVKWMHGCFFGIRIAYVEFLSTYCHEQFESSEILLWEIIQYLKEDFMDVLYHVMLLKGEGIATASMKYFLKVNLS